MNRPFTSDIASGSQKLELDVKESDVLEREKITILAFVHLARFSRRQKHANAFGAPGDFIMGSEYDYLEKPVHTIYLDDYYIDKYEVTNGFYKACVAASVCKPPKYIGSFERGYYFGNPGYDDYPVILVDWNMAKTYCEWRGAQLPTEAQWEKAARGTDSRTYPWGEGADCSKANFHDQNFSCAGNTVQVGSFENGKSPYGVYDMAGNISEWVADWYSETYYQTSPATNPLGPASGEHRVLRGGSYGDFDFFIRSSYRGWSPPDSAFYGFRCSKPAFQSRRVSVDSSAII